MADVQGNQLRMVRVANEILLLIQMHIQSCEVPYGLIGPYSCSFNDGPSNFDYKEKRVGFINRKKIKFAYTKENNLYFLLTSDFIFDK